jgi:hypothetical protein
MPWQGPAAGPLEGAFTPSPPERCIYCRATHLRTSYCCRLRMAGSDSSDSSSDSQSSQSSGSRSGSDSRSGSESDDTGQDQAEGSDLTPYSVPPTQ